MTIQILSKLSRVSRETTSYIINKFKNENALLKYIKTLSRMVKSN